MARMEKFNGKMFIFAMVRLAANCYEISSNNQLMENLLVFDRWKDYETFFLRRIEREIIYIRESEKHVKGRIQS